MDPRSRDVEAAALLAPKKNYFVGLGLLGIVVLLWTSSNYLIQNLLEGGYDKPFLLTYLSTSTFTLYLVPFALREREAIGLWWRKLRRRQGYDRSYYSLLSGSSDSETLSPLRPLAQDHALHNHTDQLTTAETAKLALKFSFFWFIANWSVNASLAYTSVASTTILTTTSGFFTLGVGALFKVEKFTLIKCGAVIASFCGVVLVALSDSTSRQTDDVSLFTLGANALVGDSLALFSALFYALYVVLLKVGIGSEDRVQMQLFFGFIGVFTFTLFWPFGLLLHATGMESLAFPHGRIEILSVLFNCSITFVSDYLFLLAMLKTTPLLVTIGLSMTIPTALFGDWFLGRPTAAQALLGGAFVLVGFVIVGWDDANSTKKPEQLLAAEPETVERHD